MGEQDRGWGQEPLPPKKPIEPAVLWLIGIIAGGGLLIGVVLLLQPSRDERYQALVEKNRRELQALVASASAQAAASAAAPTVAATTAPIDPCGHSVAQGTITGFCRNQIRTQLKAPSTAKFPGLFSSDEHVSKSGCVTTVSSWVDSQNSFGAVLRSDTTCTYDATTGTASVTIDGN